MRKLTNHGGRGFSSRLRLRRRSRGISLLEILVAIFILSIGLLGVASLIPVGNSEVIKASIAHRSAETGLRAFREMKLRGYLNPQNWLSGGQAVVDPETGVMRPDFSGKTLVIDPLTSQVGGQSIPVANVKTLTLRSAMATENNTSSPPMPAPVAERVFVGQDNLLFERPREQTRVPMQFREGQNGPRRRTDPLYSWMAMLSPMQVMPSGTLAPEFRLDTYLMSVIVFYRDTPGQRPRTALTMTAQSLGGNEFRLTMPQGADEEAKKFLRPRRWILLTDSDRLFRWYRVGTVEGSVAEDRPDRVVSLMGPDWDSKATRDPTAIVFESVVAVIEKTVQLEGTTMWSPGASPNAGKK
ncbi:MAG: prepilin-type N-terminal cleavage/methylation domain-containing protein [Pirellulales bacterium]